ncbi:hypothetical protein [Chryseobacterium sp. P1-3]|uniref:hypothetical protein n=1 Tax=Chryseobacterium sp. (strain P1-3) TaxID=1517683 RepID=UPI000B121E17|nr:hypothetical protein [Chryseobacterium sp. P1-3]
MNKTILFAFLFVQNITFAQSSERSLSSESWQFKNSKENKWLSAKSPGNGSPGSDE